MTVLAERAGTNRDLVLPGAGLMIALGLRVAIGGHDVAGSFVGAAAFAATLLTVAVMAGWRPSAPRPGHMAIGVAGAAVLVALPFVVGGHLVNSAHGPITLLVVWGALVTFVAVGEEVVLRGVLFSALEARRGPITASVVAAILFALLHIPLYGWRALPLDLAVGLWLGSLRVVSGAVTAPAVAHLLADLATWWL